MQYLHHPSTLSRLVCRRKSYWHWLCRNSVSGLENNLSLVLSRVTCTASRQRLSPGAQGQGGLQYAGFGLSGLFLSQLCLCFAPLLEMWVPRLVGFLTYAVLQIWVLKWKQFKEFSFWEEQYLALSKNHILIMGLSRWLYPTRKIHNCESLWKF